MASKEQEVKKLHDRMAELEVRIGQLNLEKHNYADIIKGHNQKHKEQDREIAKRDEWITQL